MPKFRTQYDRQAPVFQEPGSPEKLVYSPRYTEDGVLDLQVTGKENLYEFIQSHKESTDIHVLLTRFANGEEDVLSRMQGFYADVTSMPKTYAEVLNAVIVGEETFARLPVEVKQRFDNSFAVWLSSMDSPDFAKRMGVEPPPGSDLPGQQVLDFASNTQIPGSPPPAAQPSQTTPAQPSSSAPASV
ncbi:internal scaffolding protein [Sigmofec virus UA08Rod_5707]|uniref:Internal scaffolding protein n=1 Tax=Sigmofec virus UA08Rod_5707 TaxID=2929437 RepID=A0A976N1A8_9VIRU|nr:internal scaffolding protein [Sigmofec virus UA08Rod_5707]